MNTRPTAHGYQPRMTHPETGLVDYRPALEQPEAGRALRWVIVLVLVALTFFLGFASGTAYAAQQPVAKKQPNVDSCIRSFEVRPGIMQRLRMYDIEARVRIEQHRDHRAFTISYQSDTGVAGGTFRELNNVEGELSPITQDPIWFKSTPGGQYVVVLAVYGAGGKLLERRTAEIRTPDDGDDR